MISNKENLFKEIVRRIVEVAHPDKVVLFGSMARGENNPSSDIDILVIARSEEPRHRRSAKIYGALSNLIFPMDIVVYSPKEVDEWSGVKQAFVTTALREGRVLYENQG
jgi:predicted nucleotidyltransferase